MKIAEAGPEDLDNSIGTARHAFDTGPWPRLTHLERAEYLRAFADGLAARSHDLAQIWPRQSGVLHSIARHAGEGAAGLFRFYAELASSFEFEQQIPPTAGGAFGLLVREPVGVVGAIVPWNAPLVLTSVKIAPALLAGCTVILKLSPEAPGEGYVIAEVAEQIGLPPGVLNVVTADRETSELLVRDPRVDKITFTGSTQAGKRIASICGGRVARFTLELGGKSAAIVLDDMDLSDVARILTESECMLSGQVCASLTRVIVSRHRHDDLAHELAERFSAIQVGDPFDSASEMGPLATERQRARVENYIARGIADGATLLAGGGRPQQVDRGWYIEPTIFGDVDNSTTIAQEEIFGPVLSIIPADDEKHAVHIANDSAYGLNASVFTNDADRVLSIAREIRSGTVGHNAVRGDFGVAAGGYKQSGIGREGGREGLLPFLETKYVVLEATPRGAADPAVGA